MSILKCSLFMLSSRLSPFFYATLRQSASLLAVAKIDHFTPFHRRIIRGTKIPVLLSIALFAHFLTTSGCIAVTQEYRPDPTHPRHSLISAPFPLSRLDSFIDSLS